MTNWWTVLVCCLLGGQGIYTKPLKEPNICGRPTCAVERKFNYQAETIYRYQYSVDVVSLFAGSSKNDSRIHIDATVELEFLTHCEGILRISEVSLTEAAAVYDREEDVDIKSPDLPHAEEFKRDITEHELRFSFNDGLISEICPNTSETSWVLNFKRGILSAFQNTMKRFDVDHTVIEGDVNGDCPTQYRLVGARGTSLALSRSKDLGQCSSRNKHRSVVQSQPYQFSSSFQSTPIIKSTSSCELTIDYKIYSKLDCQEVHTFQPFSNGDNGARTTTRQVLTLVTEVESDSEEVYHRGLVTRRTALTFDHDLTPKPTSGELKASRDLIKTMCRLNTEDVHLDYPDVFNKFVQTARLLSYPALTQVATRADGICSSGKKHILSALPLLGSNAAITVMKDMILKDAVPSDDVQTWLLALAFLPRPDLDTLRTVIPLMQHKQADAQYILSVSSMAHTYCKYSDTHCDTREELQKIVNFLENEIVAGCNDKERSRFIQEKTQVALKAIGNIGISTVSLKNQLRQCITHDFLPMATRVAAVESHRRFRCEVDRDHFLHLYRNQSVDPELRIASYLQVMRCPNYLVVTTIRHTLQDEEVNQVGSFVWSHLSNLLSSSIPSRIEIQGLLQEKDLVKKFNSDIRKFSRNYEGSMFFDEYNVGGNLDSNIIFSPKSYIPRSAMLNFTVDLFGESINVFEVAGRMEGFESYVESFFGPRGPFSSKAISERLETYQEKLRFARSVHDQLKSKFEELPNVIDNNFNIPKTILGLKIFGNDIAYKSLAGDDEIRSALSAVNPVMKLKQLLSGKEINYDKTTLFMDTSFIVPTGTGLPVTLSAVGTAAINLKMSGRLAAGHINSTYHLDLEGKLRPSVALDVVGTMGVDAYYASTGIKLKTNLYSSAAVEGVVKVRGSRLVSMEFSLPKDRTDIVSVRSELVVMKGEREEPQAGVTEDRVEKVLCSWPAVERTLGLNLCVALGVRLPNSTDHLNTSHAILNGPTNLGVSLRKADLTAKKYVLEYKCESTQTNTHVSLVFDTPGSKIKRELSAKLNLDKQSQNLTLILQSSENRFEAFGTYKNTENEKYLNFGLDINGEKHLDAQLGLKTKMGNNNSSMTYNPRLYIAINNERIAELAGSLKWVEKQAIAQCDVNLEFHTKKFATKLNGYLRKSDFSIMSDVTLKYRFEKEEEERVRIETSWSNRSKGSMVVIHSEVALESSAYKQFNFKASMKYQKALGHVDCKIEINTNPEKTDDRFKLTLQVVFTFVSTQDGKKMNTYLTITKPISEIDLKFSFNYHEIDQRSNAVALIRYATGKEIIATLNLEMPTNALYYLDAKLNISVPSFNAMLISLRIHEKTPREFDIDFSGTWFSGHSISSKGVYQDKSTSKGRNHNLKLIIKSPSFHEVAVNCKLLKDDQEFRLEIQGDHNNDKYGLLLKHRSPSVTEASSHLEVNYRNRVYSVAAALNLAQARQLHLEVHLDRMRDVHLTLRAVNRPARKEAGLEIKWDANRDPSQKFAASLEFSQLESLNYSGGFLVSFPGRTVKGDFLFGLKGNNLTTSAHLEWSPSDQVDIKFHTSYEHTSEFLLVKVNSELLTPFDNWKRTSLNGGLRYQDYLIRANGSVYWQDDQHIALDVFGEYAVKEEDFRCEFNSSIFSNIPQVSSMSGSFYHKQTRNKYNTNILMQYNPHDKIALSSDWTLDENEDSTNLTGIVRMVSPFPGYKKGQMISQVCISKDMDIKGVADLEMEKKEYTLSVIGHLKHITNSMLDFNITTPIQKYHTITGRFGYSEARRHLVAEIKGPTGAIGIEILFSVTSTSLFDVQFHVATPIEMLQKVLVVAKLNPNSADFRCGWNNLTLGFTGVWHYENALDFEYSYKLFTPLEGFEENGLVAKLIHKKKMDVDVELSIKLADIKFGVKVQGQSKSRLLEGLNLPKAVSEDGEEDEDAEEGSEETSDEDEDQEINWRGLVAIDTIVYPTIQGTLDIDNREKHFTVQSTLKLPNGTAHLYNEFFMKHVFHITNTLRLTTPFDRFSELSSDYIFLVSLETGHYIMSVNADLKQNDEWIKSGMCFNYTTEINEEDDREVREAVYQIHTPFEILRNLETKLLIEIEENIYRTNFSLNTNKSHVDLGLNWEKDKAFFEVSFEMSMDTPLYGVPRFRVTARRDFVGTEKSLELLIMRFNPDSILYGIEGAWHYEPSSTFKTRVNLHTPLERLPSLGGTIFFTRNTKENSFSFDTGLTYGTKKELRLAGLITSNQISIELETPLENFRRFHVNGTIRGPEPHLRRVMATGAHDGHAFQVLGDIAISEEKPLEVKLSTTNQNGKEITTMLIIHKRTDGFAFGASLIIGKENLKLDGDVTIRPNEWIAHTKITSTHHTYNLFEFNGNFLRQTNGNVTVDLDTKTSVQGLERFRFAGSSFITARIGKVKALFDITQAKGSFSGEWIWIWYENMVAKILLSYDSDTVNKHITSELYYKNPKKSFKYLSCGVDANYNKNEWQFGTNGTLNFPASGDISIQLNLKLPPPDFDVHTVMAKVQYTESLNHVVEVIKYYRAHSTTMYGTSGEYSQSESGNINGNLQFEWNQDKLKTIRNIFDLKRNNKQIDMVYALRTPYYQEDTFVAKMFYDEDQEYHKVKADMFSPANNYISGAQFAYNSFSNMNGTVNTTTPFDTIPYLGVNFETLTTALKNKRFAELFWPNNTAFVKSMYVYKTKNYNTQLNGSLIVELPLATRHYGKIVYGYKEEPLQKTGYSFVEYNKKRFLEGKYKCDTVSSAGLEKDTINIEIENNFHPIGVLYIQQQEYSGGMDGYNLPTIDTKRVEVFKLHKRSDFNLTGEVKVRTTFTGQEIVLTAIHLNRTITLSTDYDFLDHEFKSKTLLTLGQNAWAGYDLRIINKTTAERTEDHMELNFAYPKRNYTVTGYYQLLNNSLSSEATFIWDKQAKKKTVGASLDWKRLSSVPNRQHAVVSIKHPSFRRDVTLNAQYFSDKKDLLDLNTDLVYSEDDSKKVLLSAKLQDNSRSDEKHYHVLLLGSHPATRFNLNVNGELRISKELFMANSAGEYKRTYFPLQVGHAKAKVDIVGKEVDIEKSSQGDVSFLRGKYIGNYPQYTMNGSFAKGGTEINGTSFFNLDLNEQLVLANINFTSDASQSFHTHGRIPDSRNAIFNIWRQYEGEVISDVAFYLRLNHSRLVTSKLAWRPELEADIKNGIHETFDESVNAFYDSVDYWKQYIKSEICDVVNDVWLDAKPVIQDFLDDISELKYLEEDVESFKTVLNNSYNANEFYIKDIVNVTCYLLDELAIRGQIESFPDILNEMWGIMGESGEAIRNSLLWIIEALKTSYKNAVEFIHSVLRGDAMKNLSAVVEGLIEKYDKMVKDLHVSFMKHIVNLWHRFTDMVKTNWHNMMLAIEPTLMKFAYYLDMSVHHIHVELLEFLYQRKSDIVGSPYFARFANFTQDIDRLYKDIQANDWVTNIKKYSKIAFDFISERYFTIVPFGKELQEIWKEIITEFKQLLKLPSINYVLTKAKELYAKIEYLYDYFDVGTKIQQATNFLRAKIADISQTALQAENRYREAKTKFIFDPENGLVELEQKLPMSWHAFNETPKFEEIPEYKRINDIQNYFIASNTTFWTLYYEYKPCTEPSNWLPPFSAKAIMAGPQHFMTFDRRFFEYRGMCTYLLAHDFVHNNFSLAVSYHPNNKLEVYEIILVIDGQTVVVDVFQDTVKVLNADVKKLPIQFGNTYVYQYAQMLAVENSEGFSMDCNLKYDVCTFALSGWYYGKTAGLLGTMDNEPSTDFLTSTNLVDQDLGNFAHSWALDPQKCTTTKNYAIELHKQDLVIKEKCELFFKSKLSEFSHCFSVVDPSPFMRMCLNSRVINEHEACTAAIAYMQACLMENTPLRIPDTCVTCQMNETDLPEGHFIELKGSQVPQSTDVVFIVEAKECNRDLKSKKNLDILISSLAKELGAAKLIANRYAVVVFGGDGVYDEPRSVVLNNKIFSIPQEILHYFENIPIGDGSSDIFGALRFAAKLIFRAGVSKTFILLPCTNCDPSNMMLDFTVMHQVLLENDITLHILMKDDFIINKTREGLEKGFFGLDGNTAYTKKDVREMKGDASLRKQVKLPKSMLGLCTPLSLETNGTVFTAKKLENDGKKKHLAKKLATVFGKRVAASARPVSCQNCECTADNNGMSYMECFPCEMPIPSDIDYGFNEDEEYSSALLSHDSASIDEEEE